MIISAENPHIKQLRTLITQAKSRRDRRQTVLEGAHLLASALNSGVKPYRIYVPQSRFGSAEVLTLLQQVAPESVIAIGDHLARQVSPLDNAVEVFSIIDIPNVQHIDFNQDCLVMERVQDPGNLGALLRIAAAGGIRQIICNRHCADAFSPKVLRAAMGAHFGLNIFESVDLIDFLKQFLGQIYVTTLHAKVQKNLYQLDLRSTPNAWILGNEGNGVSDELLQMVDFGVNIPMIGQVESLNVAASAAVCLFEQLRQRNFHESH